MYFGYYRCCFYCMKCCEKVISHIVVCRCFADVYGHFKCFIIHSMWPRSVASDVQCSFIGVSSASFSHFSTLYTANDVVGGQVLSL